MRTEDLIADLAQRATPVRPLPPPAVRALGWIALAAACGAVGVAAFGARADVLVRLTQPDYLWIAVLAVSTSMFAVLVSLVLSIPGAERTPVLRVCTLGLLGLWAVTIVRAVLAVGRGLPFSTDLHWPVCFMRVLAVAVVPAVVLFVMVRRAHPLRLGWTAAMAALAAAPVGALAVQIACPFDDPGHGFLGHFMPVLVIAAIGFAARRNVAGRTAP